MKRLRMMKSGALVVAHTFHQHFNKIVIFNDHYFKELRLMLVIHIYIVIVLS